MPPACPVVFTSAATELQNLCALIDATGLSGGFQVADTRIAKPMRVD